MTRTLNELELDKASNEHCMMDNLTVSRNTVDAGHVYFVATPIGNIHDMTPRAVEVLTHVDYICAEDTRHTIKLMKHLKIPPKEIFSHHEHNWKATIPKILDLVQRGNSVAVVSDAGTPGISDPGAQLAHALGQNNVIMHPVPGASAVVSALSVSGFPCTPFTFMGFLPMKTKERKAKLQEMFNTQHTLVFFEAPHKVRETFSDLMRLDQNFTGVDVKGVPYNMKDRKVVCCRELTKLHEETRRGSVADIMQWLDDLCNKGKKKFNIQSKDIRGEFCIVMGPVVEPKEKDRHYSLIHSDISDPDEEEEEDISAAAETLEEKIRHQLCLLRGDKMGRKDAVVLVTEMLKVPKSVVYNIGLKMKWEI